MLPSLHNGVHGTYPDDTATRGQQGWKVLVAVTGILEEEGSEASCTLEHSLCFWCPASPFPLNHPSAQPPAHLTNEGAAFSLYDSVTGVLGTKTEVSWTKAPVSHG